MRLIKYILSVFIVLTLFISYNYFNSELKKINNIIYNDSLKINELIAIKTEFEHLQNYKDIINSKALEKELSDLKIQSNGKDQEEITAEYEILFNQKNSHIKEASTLRIIRDRLLFITFFTIIFILTLNIITYRYFYRKISYYLKKIEFKNYDFNVYESKISYLNNILKKIDNLKTTLETNDDAIKVILSGHGINETLKRIFNNKSFKNYLNFDRIGFATIYGEMIVASISYSKKEKIELKEGYSVKLMDTSLKQLAETKTIRIINNLKYYYKQKPTSNHTKYLLDEGYNSNLTAPITNSKGEVAAFIFFSCEKVNGFEESDKFKVKAISELLSSIFSKNMLIDDLITNTSVSFVKLVEGRDPETSNHIERMQIYSKIISEKLIEKGIYPNELSYEKYHDIYKYAPLHDIGKVGIPDNILLKPGRLLDNEMEVMKTHSTIGANVLASFENNLQKYNQSFINTAINIAKYHHEKWDGTGYPEGLSKKEIPIESRIITVADVFDALSSKRVYKKAFSFDKSVEMIKTASGLSFDPEVVEAFIDSLDKIAEVYNQLKEV